MGNKLPKIVSIKRDVIDGLLGYCNNLHSREAILLVRGKNLKNEILINALVIPPLPVHGETFTSFPIHMLPIDPSILGTAHSHPNGVLRPSNEDLNNYFGKVMLIIGFPYLSKKDIEVFDREGNRATFTVK